jgi:hypothetical protein
LVEWKKEKNEERKKSEFIIFKKKIEEGLEMVELYKNWLEWEKIIKKEKGEEW